MDCEDGPGRLGLTASQLGPGKTVWLVHLLFCLMEQRAQTVWGAPDPGKVKEEPLTQGGKCPQCLFQYSLLCFDWSCCAIHMLYLYDKLMCII